jgi:uncharacterized membrane protein YoaK (UPF0700 family)
LSFAAGCVDAISFVGFGGVFTANMTGNTVLLGIAISAHFGAMKSQGVLPPLIAIVAFIVGASAALPVLRAGFDARRAGAIVAAEAILIALAGIGFASLGGPVGVPLSIAFASLAMGAQSIVATKAGLPGISTTYVTGTLVTAITRGLVSGAQDRGRRDAAHAAWTWVVYLAGAAVGTVLYIALYRAALLPTVALFIGLAAWISNLPRRFPQ